MADLEAISRIETAPAGVTRESTAGQYTWRYLLPKEKAIRLGGDPTYCDWAVPEDRKISRFHATIKWDGERLTVARRGVVPPDHPNLPPYPINFAGAPVERCVILAGECFEIGDTTFTLRGDDEQEPDSPVDCTIVQREDALSRAELEELPFANPTPLLTAMERLPSYLKLATNEPLLFRQMLKVVLDALPRADAAGVVHIPSDGRPEDLRVAMVEQNIRTSSVALAGEFTPSRRLIQRAVRARKSCLHIWHTPSGGANPDHAREAEATLATMHKQGVTPWAICTPFQDGSKYALYVSGRLSATEVAESKRERHLNQYQKVVELLVGLLETTRRTLKLARQNTVIREAWPSGIRKYLDNPDRLEALLKPQEKDVTVLFCDLRNYSLQTEAKADQLTQAWREVASALDIMSGSVTEKGGVVAGFRGDAVLGFWGWPDYLPDQVERAAAVALKIQERLSGWMQQRKCGLGLTHGRALAGRLGAHDLAVVDLYGPVVNLAFRLEEMTKAFGVGIIVSDPIAARLAEVDPDGTQWRTRRLGQVRPRGVKSVVTAHELLPLTSPAGNPWASEFYAEMRAQWEEAVDWLTAGDWPAAGDRLGNLFPDDPAAQCLLRVVSGRKPPLNWDGAFSPPQPKD